MLASPRITHGSIPMRGGTPYDNRVSIRISIWFLLSMDIPPTTVVQKDCTCITDNDYAHITGSNKSIFYISALGVGGQGEVHQVKPD